MAIATQLLLKYETVKKYVYRKKLVAGLPPKVIIKKSYFTGRIGLLIKNYIEENPLARVEDIRLACNLTCQRTTLNRWLNTNNLDRTKAKRNILLRDVNKVKRIAFCTEMLTWSDEKLKLILWSDETMVKAYPNGEAVFYRAQTKLPHLVSPAVQQGGSGQMLWGCISYYAYGPLEAVEGYITSEKYLTLLKNVVEPEMNSSRQANRVLVFQQDNAKAHKTPAVMEYFGSWGYQLLDWPPQSPDLSPIENIWNVMKMKLKAMRPRPRTKATMRNAMMDIWDELDDTIRENLIMTFRSRCEKCIENKGELVRF